ncbi:TPR repeat-containing protein YrrB [Peptococcaceae bacterium CEB3]|nr:TPR repeat-containing protein YrrB [Peptococcaceae bacterium CEB3]
MSHPLVSKTGDERRQVPVFWREFKANVLSLRGKNDEAIEVWVELLRSDLPRPQFQIVEKLIKARVYVEAKEYLERLVEKPGGDLGEIKYQLARSCLGLGLVQEAKEAIEEALEVGPEKAAYWSIVADCRLEQGEWRLAAEALDKSLRADPKQAETVFRLGTIYSYNGEYAEALRCFSGACQLQPRKVGYWEMKAEMHLELGQIKEACFSYKQALRYCADPEIMARTAYCYVQLDEIEKGTRYYEKTLKHEPDHYDSLCNLAAIYQNQGRSNEALRLLERAHSIFPNDAILLNNLAYIMVHLGRTRKAQEYYQAALSLTPQHPLILYNLSVCLASKGEWNGAIEIIQQLLEIDPDHSDAWALLGNIYDEIAEPELAIDCFNKALKLA